MLRKLVPLCLSLTLAVLVFSGTAQAGWNPLKTESAEKQKNIKDPKVAEAIANFKNKDSSMGVFFKKAYGYAIFPTVGKGGIGIGGAYGKGEVYERGQLVGRSSLTQLTIGFQLGGQAYSEIIFFKDKNALNDFKSGNFEFGAQASAVAVTAGASADADYDNGVAIFTLAKGGLMYEASVGGQKFSYEAVGN
jgi:lipid-binding SYLF domain-containing protein